MPLFSLCSIVLPLRWQEVALLIGVNCTSRLWAKVLLGSLFTVSRP